MTSCAELSFGCCVQVYLDEVELVRDVDVMMDANDSFRAFPEHDGAVNTSVTVARATPKPSSHGEFRATVP